MNRSASQQRHQMFLRYIWIATPFLLVWLWAPGLQERLSSVVIERSRMAAEAVVIYLAIRTLIARFGSPRLRWERIFPVSDVIAVSTLIYAGNREPVSNLATLYLIAIVEASESLSIRWVLGVSLMIAVGEAFATWNHRMSDPFGAVYPYVFIFFASAISGLLARSVAMNRDQLAVARDRERIAFEMHDGVQGHLVTIASQLELVSHLAASDPEKTASLAREGRNLARLAADELRYLVQRLRSPSINEGFSASLRQFAYNVSQRAEIDLEAEVMDEPDLTPEQEHAMFRIAQEAITNVIRHSGAKKIVLSLAGDANWIEMTIADDGQGFDLKAGTPSGLASMKSRAESVGGGLEMDSSAKGTVVRKELWFGSGCLASHERGSSGVGGG